MGKRNKVVKTEDIKKLENSEDTSKSCCSNFMSFMSRLLHKKANKKATTVSPSITDRMAIWDAEHYLTNSGVEIASSQSSDTETESGQPSDTKIANNLWTTKSKNTEEGITLH